MSLELVKEPVESRSQIYRSCHPTDFELLGRYPCLKIYIEVPNGLGGPALERLRVKKRWHPTMHMHGDKGPLAGLPRASLPAETTHNY